MPAARLEWRQRIYFVIMVLLAGAGSVRVRAADARVSPLAYVAQAKTPFMLIQGEGDTTDPLGESLEMYRALRQQGVVVQMLQYPRDNDGPLGMNMHGFPSTEPWHGFDARRRLVEFIKSAFDKSGG